jgi:hypothetical protein
VRWTLSTRAPGSRWTLERARGEGGFDSLTTVRAGDDTVLVVDDPTATPGTPWRYRVRRESVDLRYRWHSAASAAHWRPDTREPLRLSLASVATDGTLALRLGGAAPPVTARLHDLQGRVVLARRLDTGGTGDDALVLPLAGSAAAAPGVYFLRVTDATGRSSRTARVAVLR